MNTHSSLPPFGSTGFTVAEALRLGVSSERLRGRDLAAPYWGVRVSAASSLTLPTRCRLVMRRLGPGVFASHRTAAELWQMHLETPAGSPLDLAVVAPRRAPHATAIRGHSLRLVSAEVTRRSGVPVTTPLRTWLDLAAGGATVEELMIAGERIVHGRAPLASIADLARGVERWRGRGVRSLHEALPLLSDRSDSGRETRVRRAITSAGLPAPSPQHRVYDDHGELIGVADQAFPEYRVLLEYEGDHHRTDRRQWNIDLVRFNRYQQSGWIALRIEARQLAALTPMLDSVESALRSRGWRRDA